MNQPRRTYKRGIPHKWTSLPNIYDDGYDDGYDE